MKVIFKQLNPEKFAELIFDMKECISAENLHREDSCFHFDIPEEIAKEIINSEKLTKELNEKIIYLIKDYKEVEEKIIHRIQDFWDKEVERIFFKEMEKHMPNCSDSEYICYVTDKMVGSYFEESREVVLNLMKGKNEAWLSSIVAEEILHLIYWKFWSKIFNKEMTLEERFDIGNEGVNGWMISEIIPDYLLIENNVFKKFGWDKIDRSKGYRWIRNLRKRVDPLWVEKKDFSDFIIKVHKLCDFKRQ